MRTQTSDMGVIVGRFQVHRLHEAHLALIKSVYDTHPHTVIVLGLSVCRVTMRNPLDFEARKQMLLETFPKATILYIKDQRSDDVWSKQLDILIKDIARPRGPVMLYGGRDSFISHYTGKYPTTVLEPEVYASGTELRKDIERAVKASEDFRAGVIWASANGYPRAFPTVDVGIWRPTTKIGPGSANDPDAIYSTKEWLLVRKPNEPLWRLPGGFVDPADGSYEQTARREVSEETGAAIDGLQYVGSTQVDDWRYRTEEDKILTLLFAAQYISGPVTPADDVAEAKWFAAPLDEANVMAEHRPLMKLLKGGWL